MKNLSSQICLWASIAFMAFGLELSAIYLLIAAIYYKD